MAEAPLDTDKYNPEARQQEMQRPKRQEGTVPSLQREKTLGRAINTNTSNITCYLFLHGQHCAPYIISSNLYSLRKKSVLISRRYVN